MLKLGFNVNLRLSSLDVKLLLSTLGCVTRHVFLYDSQALIVFFFYNS